MEFPPPSPLSFSELIGRAFYRAVPDMPQCLQLLRVWGLGVGSPKFPKCWPAITTPILREEMCKTFTHTHTHTPAVSLEKLKPRNDSTSACESV